MDLGNHWEFIVAAYCLAILVIGGLILWIVGDHRAQLRTLADLEARGLRRRSRQQDGPA
ncbi:MAG: heme exporter protein CcmD [Labrys sp. (in: a-proteobacteria)]